MNHPSPLKRISVIVQIIALMICTLASNALPTYAQTTLPTDTQETVATETVTEPTTAPTDPPATEDDDTLSDEEMQFVQQLQTQRLELLQQAQALQDARQQYSDTLDGLLQQKTNIEDQIALKQREIDINAQLTDSLNAQIRKNDLELIQSEQSTLVRRQSILTRFEDLRQKLRALSKSSKLTTIQMLASSDSYTSYLINSKMAQRLAAVDQATINGLEDELTVIQSERRMLRLKQDDLEAKLAPYIAAGQDLANSKRELQALHTEATAISDQLSSNITYYREQYLALSQQQTIIQQQLHDILKDFSSSDMLAPSVMNWPAPECPVITSSYKARWGRWHYGLDIAAWGDSTGKPIVAAADGVVIFSGTDDSGFGNYVMIDHGHDIYGQRIVTLYAHCHELYAQVGDVVFGGQTLIASVGNTGNSNGAHLHFEVRVDSNAVDPIANGYLSTDGITVMD